MGRSLPLLLGLALLVGACDQRASAPDGAARLRTAAPSATVSTLPRPDEERAIVRALEGEGVRVTRVTGSKFDWLFGAAAPRAATFETVVDGQTAWADVHFFDRRAASIVACGGLPDTSEAHTFSIAVDGRLQSLQGTVTGSLSSGRMYFATSDRYFVMTPDLGVREALRRALALAIPPCRSPVSLPLLPWEHEVVEALHRAGIEVTLVGASKFETLLGERRPARAFIARHGAGGSGADVVFLERPLAGVRVCVSDAPSGLSRWDVFVGDRRVSSGEGAARIHHSTSDRYFVQAFGAEYHQALMRGLGTREAPC